MEADELNSVQIRVVVAACGVEIKLNVGIQAEMRVIRKTRWKL